MINSLNRTFVPVTFAATHFNPEQRPRRAFPLLSSRAVEHAMHFLRWLRHRLHIRELDGEKALCWATHNYDGKLRGVAAKVGKIVMEHLGIDISTATPAARFVKDLHKSDLECVELLLAVEDEFGIEIAEADAERVSTVGGLVEYVCERLQNSA